MIEKVTVWGVYTMLTIVFMFCLFGLINLGMTIVHAIFGG